MPAISKPIPEGISFAPAFTPGFAAMSARRLYIFGGIALIAGGLLFGDIFAVFILHQNAARQGEALLAAARGVAARDSASVDEAFRNLGSTLEDRGTKVDAHVHMIGAGYLALLLALVQPYVALSQQTKKSLAALFIAGGVLLPVGIFLIRYVGLAGSPFSAIGWASVLADSAGALLIIVLIVEAWGFSKYVRSHELSESLVPESDSMPSRALLSGGTILVLLGFVHGAYYAGAFLYEHERMETAILQRLVSFSAVGNFDAAAAEVSNFGGLAGARAVNIAAHSHIIEFGLLAMLLSFVQPFVFLSEEWKRRWVKLLLGGSVILPVFVLLELKLGLLAGGIADIGGLMVIVALVGMLVGILRYSGRLDFAERNGSESDAAGHEQWNIAGSRKLLIFGGMALAAFGMFYGLQYALFTEHQTLDRMGGSLAQSFASAASRNSGQSQSALRQYGETKYDYVREVDAHSHWIGLAMLMIVLGAIFDRMNFAEGIRRLVAICLLSGSVLFPLAVIFETYHHDSSFKALAVVGSGLVIAGLTATAWGFGRHRTTN
jgi:hypothetical protein